MKHEKAETSAVNLKARVEAYERVLVVEALRRTKGNQSRAGELLGTFQRIVNYKIRKYRLDLCLFR